MKKNLSVLEVQDKLERILLKVEKPGRYVGGEYNQVVKPWEKVDCRVALAFPDIYDIGQSNYGLAILYDLLNKRADVLAERVYTPWLDMETAMREAGIPLYSLESKHLITDFDILGISLPYESLFTNVLNLLDLAGIPLLSRERTAEHPLVIAGGHAAFNPEPMSSFIDAFTIGEGEEVIQEIVNCMIRWQASGTSRQQLMETLSQLEGVYVPSLYSASYNEDGTTAGMIKLYDPAPLPITKRVLVELPPPPIHLIVPSIDVVHNRIPIEIMRGCTRGCRFCHAGMINRPVRQRPVAQIVQAVQESLDNTGYEEVALLSLSSSDYSQIQELVEALTTHFEGQHLVISLPSLRIETFSIEIMEQLKGSRPGGFTLAPEAATERMRNIINKPISSQQLLETVAAIYSRGWTTIKLYFMIGHPSETLEDVKAIADLCKAVLSEGRKVIGKRASLHVGVSTFIPKPHTPFQWANCDPIGQIENKQKLLRKEFGSSSIKMNWSDPDETMFESWMSRGDRRLGDVIYLAWKIGAKFDAWQDQFNYAAWQEAFKQMSLDPAFYTHRQRSLDEVFPWDHINSGVRKSYLAQDYRWSLEGKLRPDCREQCNVCGIQTAYAELRRENPNADWYCPEIE